MAKAKRKPGAPEFAVKPKKRGAKVVRDEVRMEHVRSILTRTAASRAQIDASIEGVDMSDLDHLPVVEFPRGRPKMPGMRGKQPKNDDVADFDPAVDAMPPKPPIAPPVAFVPELERAAGILNAGGNRKTISCSACGGTDHRCDSHKCPEHPMYGETDGDRCHILLKVDTIDKLEAIRMKTGSLTTEEVVMVLCLSANIPAPTPEPSPSMVEEIPEEMPILPESIPVIIPARRASDDDDSFRTLAVRMPTRLRTELFRMAGEYDLSIDDLVNVALAGLIGVPMHDEPAEEPPSIYRPFSDTYEVIPSLATMNRRGEPRKRKGYKCTLCGTQGCRRDRCPLNQTETVAASASA